MLHAVLILGKLGLALFEKQWRIVDTQKKGLGNLYGPLITTLQGYAKQAVGYSIAYVEYSQVAVTFVSDTRHNLLCFLMHDIEDGQKFGRVIATSFLETFVGEYPSVDFANMVVVENKFGGFKSKIVESINTSAKSILFELAQTTRGIENMFLYDDKDTLFSVDRLEDVVGVAANLRALINFSLDILNTKHDTLEVLSVELDERIVNIYSITNVFVICLCSKSVDRKVYEPRVQEAIELLTRVFSLLADLHE